MRNSKKIAGRQARTSATTDKDEPGEAGKTNEGALEASQDSTLGKFWSNTKKKVLSGGGVSRDDVVWCYRNLLRREPESDAIIDGHLGTSDFKQLITTFLDSQEFRAMSSGVNLGGSGSAPGLPPLLDRLRIEMDSSQEELGKCAAKIKTTWEYLGQEKAHFSVLTYEAFLPKNLSDSIDTFWATGEVEAATATRTIGQYGLGDLEGKICVEYGCGVGRVTVNFAKQFKFVHGYDISRNHLQHARARANELGRNNIEFHECSKDFRVAIEPCDFFYSVIVLQHNPPPVIMELIRIALTALRPGGIAIFQVPTYIVEYQFSLAEWLATDHAMDMQMHCVPQDAVFDTISATGCRLIGLREDGWTSAPDTMISNTFFCRKQ